jgi:hypothetical protein
MKKKDKPQRTGYKGTGKKIRVLKWIRNFFKGKL